MTTNDADWSKHPCYKMDPLPGIEPALLNSADIKRYVDEGCLLEKDSFDPGRIKPASYEMRFLGELYHWEEVNGRLQKQWRKVSERDCIELSKNSISYLWTKERLRLPEYIAARFNLRIRDVHKGILLGTGPLIDPGFGGRILIPLHNLTDNDYVLTGGDGIIWVEFTKVSRNRYWLAGHEDTERPSGLVAFPSEKVIDDSLVYLNKAGVLDAGGVQSAFKGVLESTRRDAADASVAAEDAKERVEKLEKRTRAFTLAGSIGGAIGLVALLVSSYHLTFPVMEKVHSQRDRIGALEESVKDILEAQWNGPVLSVDEPGDGTEETALEAALPINGVEELPEPGGATGSEVGQ